ncbi:MAG TPA: RsiV family protein [Ignavibacteria bacterium]|nr:RsiV family protein [Ignavibacteria bacterium]HRF66339.1 RsiV family protein [Ignavibacteria bacterium]HRJ04317.1 RsiV family protein [Ignavibacteria bacterium]
MKTITVVLFLVLAVYTSVSQSLNIKPGSTTEADKDKYNMTANFPVIDFGPEALMGVRGIADDINGTIMKIVNGQFVPFKQQALEDTMNCPQNESTLEINYTTVYKDNGYLCFVFETFSNPRCAAHPMTFQTSFNYSYTGKGLLDISDLFTPGSGWLEYISDYCINELNARSKKDGLENNEANILEGAGPKEDNFYTFSVNEQSLNIIFNLYRVGPYVWGFQTVNIPWQGLNKMIDPKGPVGFMVK